MHMLLNKIVSTVPTKSIMGVNYHYMNDNDFSNNVFNYFAIDYNSKSISFQKGACNISPLFV